MIFMIKGWTGFSIPWQLAMKYRDWMKKNHGHQANPKNHGSDN